MSQQNLGLKAFKTGAGIVAPLPSYSRVTQVKAADANGFVGTVLLAGPNDETIGTTDQSANKAGDHVTVRMRTYTGTRKVICASICSIGDRLYPTTSGQVDTLGANGGVGTAGAAIGPAEYVALEACATAGGTVEVLPILSLAGRGLIFSSITDSATVTNTVTETAFTINQYTIPANILKVGDVLRVRGRAVVTGKNAAETLNIRGYVGGLTGVKIFDSGAVNNAANDEIYFDFQVIVTVLGATGKIQGTGLLCDGILGTATAKAASIQSTTKDTTVNNLIAVSAQWSGANAANIVLLRDLAIELVRQ